MGVGDAPLIQGRAEYEILDGADREAVRSAFASALLDLAPAEGPLVATVEVSTPRAGQIVVQATFWGTRLAPPDDWFDALASRVLDLAGEAGHAGAVRPGRVELWGGGPAPVPGTTQGRRRGVVGRLSSRRGRRWPSRPST